MDIVKSNADLSRLHEELKCHSLYQKIKSIDDLKIFMESHAFAVWDFMSLLKRLQKDITCVTLPWRPSPYPKNVVRMINEIVLGEESDLDQNGLSCDHFTLYLRAMKEVGANSHRLDNLINDLQTSKWCHEGEKEFVEFNLNLSQSGELHEVAAAFFYGREKLIPDMFTSILGDLTKQFSEKSQNEFPSLIYYLKRHIEIDGGEHSHLANDCLKALCGHDEKKWNEAIAAGKQSLKLRIALWDSVERKLLKS